MLDPNFRRGVLFVLDHDTDGALAVVINRPSELPLEVVLPGWGAAVVEPPFLFSGGPVAEDSALAVGLALGAGPDLGFKRLYWRLRPG
ncbi:MAG: YqgE/AlgH family protein [Nocardioidaceae bacterium]